MPDLDVIIPFSQRSDRCLPNLSCVVGRILAIRNPMKLCVTVVDNGEGTQSKPMDGVRWLPLRGSFNKAWACNYGFRQTDARYVAFIDGDVVLHESSFKVASRNLEDGCGGGKLIRGMYNLTEDESDRVHRSVSSGPFIKLDLGERRPRGGNRTAGAFYLTRELYSEVRGFNEAYVPLGGVDVDLTQRLISLHPKWGTGAHPALHLHHERSDKRAQNQPLLKWCTSLYEDGLKEYIANLPEDFGSVSGPQGFRPEGLS